MAKRHLSDNARIPPRGPTGHGAPYNSNGRENPTVHSKATRRYGEQGSRGDFPNSSTGQQPARSVPDTNQRPSLPIAREVTYAKPHSETVGHATDGSGRFSRPTHPLTHHTGDGDHRGASTAGAKGMADKAK